MKISTSPFKLFFSTQRFIVFAIVLTGLFVSVQSYGQAPSWIWGNGSSSVDDNAAWASAIDASGNVYATGSFIGDMTLGSYTLSNSSNYDMFIAKYDASGNVLWAQGPGNTDDQNEAFGIAVDGAGNVYVTGYFYSSSIDFGSTTLYNSNPGATADMFIVKYSSAGSVLWAKSVANDLGDVVGNDVTADASGNAYVGIKYAGDSLLFASTTFFNASSTTADMMLAKYDANGNEVWAISAGGAEDDEAYSVASDASGNVFATGFYKSLSITFGATTLNNTAVSYNDVFVVKYSSSGTLLWAKNGGGSDDDFGSDIATDVSGNCYVAGGYVSSSATFGSVTLNNAGGGLSDVFLLKYDASGTLLWAKTEGTTGDEGGATLCIDALGNSYVAGFFAGDDITFASSTLTNAYPGSGTADVFVAKYNSIGTEQWAAGAGGADNDIATCIATDASGNIYVGGYFYSPSIVFGPSTLDNLSTVSGSNTFLARLGGTVGVSSVATKASSLSIYPNPVSELLTVQLSGGMNGQLKITDIAGREVFSENITEKNQMEINASAFSKGVYFIEVISGANTYREKMVKE